MKYQGFERMHDNHVSDVSDVSDAVSDRTPLVSETSDLSLDNPTSDAVSDTSSSEEHSGLIFRPWRVIDLASIPRSTDPSVCGVDLDGDTLTLRWGGYDYNIDMAEIKAPEDLLWKIHHVGKKTWKGMTAKNISALISVVAHARGWPMYGRVCHPNEMPKAAWSKSRIEEERQKMTPALRYKILTRDGHRCRCCGNTVSTGAVLHVDHIVAVANGGETHPANLQTLCSCCNIGKRDQ